MTLNPNIAPALAQALKNKGFTALTEVQEAVLATKAANQDMLVSAQTGSGKTVAFGMAIAHTLLGEDEAFGRPDLPLALIVAPTRELALQVERELVWLYAEAKGRIASCVGGMDARAERRALQRGCHIVVGTPGRLRDHIERGGLDMSALRAVVLDEADEMLDFGFREDLEFILDTAPADRRTLLFSATVPPAITKLAKQYQKDALRLSTVGERQQHDDIEYRAMAVAPSDRENAIINTLRFHDAESALVFCATREGVNHLSSRLGNRGFSVVALSGELSQKERTHALQAMRDGRARVCVATDVASRGIDLPGLELVIHADLPTNGEVLLHRSGRTGRAGRKGVCALIVPYTRRKRADYLLRNAKIQAAWGPAPSLDDIQQKDRERLFSDPALTATYDDAALASARELLERHGAEQVAAAFLDQKQNDLPAAEELIDAPDFPERKDGKRTQRDPFVDGVWFRLTAGRNERAEPRWLLPLICRLGHVTKRDVGSIKIGERDTRFEISAAAADRFIAALAASGGGEKSIRITKDEGGPGETVSDTEAKRPRPKRAPRKPAPKNQAPQQPKPAKPAEPKPAEKKAEVKSWKKTTSKKPGGKKGGANKKARWTEAQKKAARAGGDQPPKRKKKKTQPKQD